MKLKELKEEYIKKAIESLNSIAAILKNLDCTDNSYNRKKLLEFININNIDVSHLKTRLTRKLYDLNPKYCKYCGNKIDYEHRDNDFCNHSCAASFNNGCKIKQENICLNCGKLISPRNKYCSQVCKCEYEYKEYIKNWKLGNETGIIGIDDISKHVRRYLFNKYNNKCQKCGWGEINQYTNKVPLLIHHIDGNCLNNSEDNLQLLCPNCHSLTENYGSRNKNSTRTDKRIR